MSEEPVTFEAYVARRGPDLVRFAYVLRGHRQGAEDLAQTALARAFRHWHRVSRAEHPDAYMRTIVVRTFLDARARRWTGEVPTDDLTGHEFAHGASYGDDPADGVTADAAFRHHLRRLPARAQAVLVLRYHADLPDAQIAELLHVAPGTVRSIASRSLQELRNSLAPLTPQEGPS